MGLDISVYKVMPKNTSYANSVTDYIIDIDELNKFKEVFPEYICKRREQHWDISEILRNKCGLDPDAYETIQYGGSSDIEDALMVTIKNITSDEIINYIFDKSDLSWYDEYHIKVKEIGYQRKGANQLFYEEGMWSSPPVFDLETLNKHHERYFSHETPESPGGWGSFTEYDIPDDERMQEFHNNIVSKFIEGETFVVYH